MVDHLLLKMQLSQCSTISHMLNLSTQPKNMKSSWLNSQRVLGRACWSRKWLWEALECQGTSRTQRRGLRGIHTPLPKTSRCSISIDRSDRSPRPSVQKLAVVTVRLDRSDRSSRPVRPVWLKLAVTPADRSDRSREPQTHVYKTLPDPSSQTRSIKYF